ncbi:HNH endonuclease [Kordia sp.]|uniref:HNH endonuclease n=1 Tax=Kordia sp. TaxID=1965332 RepID=UPI003D26EBAA
MKKRSKEFLEVAFYLSKFGSINDGKKNLYPPIRLGVGKWNEAYQIFYEKLNEGRTVLTFQRSLKNARDYFDSHLSSSTRIGWLSDNKKPNPLSKEAQKVYDNLINKSEEDIWKRIKKHSDLDASIYKNEFDNLISFQESESKYNTSKNEGGKKVFTSIRYERQPSLSNEAKKIHGVNCSVCGFNFEEFYGSWGKGFIEVHHTQPLSENKGLEVFTDPEKDLAVVCANCHRMIHKKRDVTLSLEELKEKIRNK